MDSVIFGWMRSRSQQSSHVTSWSNHFACSRVLPKLSSHSEFPLSLTIASSVAWKQRRQYSYSAMSSVQGLLNNTKDSNSFPLFFPTRNVTNKSGNPSIFMSPCLILPKFGYEERAGITLIILWSLT